MTTLTRQLETDSVPAASTSRTAAALRGELAFTSVAVAVLWVGCLLVGLLGFALPYARPRPPVPPVPPVSVVQVERIKVELAPQPTPLQPVVATPPPSAAPPPLFTLAAPAPATPLVPVAVPSPAVAFALPIEAPARIVELKQAVFVRPVLRAVAPAAAPLAVVRPSAPSVAAPAPAPANAPTSAGPPAVPAVESLTFGLGEGQQPAPGYPFAARRAGQEGTVVVRFSIRPDGTVLDAEASAPSPWGMLNREAVRVVREQWRFKPGPVRLYEVAIRFELTK